MARRIGDNEFAFFSSEKAIGHINGNALLALSRQPVNQKGEINSFALRAGFFGRRFQGAELVVENHFAVIEQAPDQR